MASETHRALEGPAAAPAVPIPRVVIASLPVNLGGGALAALAVAAGANALALAAIGVATALGLGLSLATMRMIRRMRLVEERRRHVRFQRDIAAMIDGHPARVTDLSLGGASLIAEMPAPPSLGSEVLLTMQLATGSTTLRATVRRALERGYFARMGIEFAEGQRDEILKLGLALLHSDVSGDVSPQPDEAGALARVA